MAGGVFTMRLREGMILGFALLGGCATNATERPQAEVVLEAAEPEWRSVAQPADLDRITRLQEAWDEALASLGSGATARRLRREGALLEPSAALPHPSPAPGSYRCRVIRFTAAVRGRSGASVTGPFFCFVGGMARACRSPGRPAQSGRAAICTRMARPGSSSSARMLSGASACRPLMRTIRNAT